MITPEDITTRAQRRWPELICAEVRGESSFPLYFNLGRPPTTGDFGAIRTAADALSRAANGWRVEWEDTDTRKWGRQRWPSGIVFDTIEDVALALGRVDELKLVRRAVEDARRLIPQLEQWLGNNAHVIAAHLPYWKDLLIVCAAFDRSPEPNCFPRQIDAAPDTKFIERHESILYELLDATLGDRVDQSAVGFTARFSLRSDPPRVRFRFLDDDLRLATSWPVDDCTVALPAFARLSWRVPQVLIVENLTVFHCLPQLRGTLAIWGAGKAVTTLAACPWLTSADVWYWGDCDEAGFDILSRLRDHIPSLQSILMDHATWTRWRHLASRGKRDPGAQCHHLHSTERAVLDEATAGPWMLEQERLPPNEVDAILRRALERTDGSELRSVTAATLLGADAHQ